MGFYLTIQGEESRTELSATTMEAAIEATQSNRENPFVINITEGPCQDNNSVCSTIMIQRPSSSQHSDITPEAHAHVSTNPSINAPLQTLQEQIIRPNGFRSYLTSWLRKEIWLSALIGGAFQYGATSFIVKLEKKQLLRLAMACSGVYSWYAVQQTRRLEQGIPALLAGILGVEIALARN